MFWKPIRIYGSYLGVVDRAEYFCNQSVGKRILHIGCADYPATLEKIENGTLLHSKITSVAKDCIGIDLSSEGLEVLMKNGISNVRYLDAEEIGALGKKFDLILAGDVVEHMTNPAGLLKAAAECLQEDGDLIISTPNTFSFNIIRYFLKGMEPTHFEHCHYFSVKTLAELCRRFDLMPVELAFTLQPPTEHKSRFFMLARNVLVRFFPRLSPSFIMKFRKMSVISQDHGFIWE